MMWTQETFKFEGKHISFPERTVVPKPLQKPHPPMWQTVSSPDRVLHGGEYRRGRARRHTLLLLSHF